MYSFAVAIVVFALFSSLGMAQPVIQSDPYVRATTQRGFQLNSGAVVENDGPENGVTNPGFERLSYGWNATGGVFSYTTLAGTFAKGIRGAQYDATGSGQCLQSEIFTPSLGLQGRGGALTISSKYPSGSSGDYVLQAYNVTDSTVDATANIPVSSGFNFTNTTFTIGTGKQYRLRVCSTTAANIVYLDSAFLGEQFPISTSAFGASALPTITNAYDLGSPSQSWRDLWISRNADIGGTLTLSALSTGVLKSDSSGIIGSSLITNSDVDASAAIARSKVAAGTASHVVINDGSGNLASEATLAVTRGGTGLSSLGSALQAIRVNGAGTANEYFTLNTSVVPEVSNLYYTDARARSSVSATSPLAYNSGTGVFSIPQSGLSTDGYLSSTDFSTFAAKQAPGNYITSLTGEVTGTGPGATATTVSNSAVITKVLTGLNTGLTGDVTATDTILAGLGKLQNATTINNAKVSGFPNPMTTNGDIIIRDSGITTRLGVGAESQVLTVFSGIPTWRNSASGFADPMTTAGDMIYRNGSNVTSRFPVGSNGDYMTVVGGLPSWTAPDFALRNLSNLASVAINTSLLPNLDNTINLGSGARQWGSLFLGTGATFSFLGTGVVKSSSTGVLSSSLVADADVDAAAAIARTKLALGTPNHVLINNGSGVMASEALLNVSRGGTGLSGATAANGTLLIGNGTGYSLATLTGTANQVSVTNGAGSITLALPQSIHTGASPTFTGLTLSGLSDGFVTSTSGVLGSVTGINLATQVSGILPTANGGTGVNGSATFPNNGIVATVPSAGVVRSNGTVLSSGTVSLTSEVSGTLPVANGGTGVTSVGTANQIFGTNAGASANEYKTLATGDAGTDFNIAHTAGTVTFNIPDTTTGTRGLVSINAQTIAGMKTFSAGIISSGRVAFTSVADATATGSNAAVTNPTRSFVRFTNASLVSIGTIGAATSDGTLAVLVNSTGNAFTIINEYGAGTAANRVITGTGADLRLESGASVFIAYDLTNARWRVIGGSGGGSGTINSTFTGTSITPAATGTQVYTYTGGSAQTAISTLFGTISAIADGTVIILTGSSDTNTFTINENDATDGWIMNGPAVLTRGVTIRFQKNNTLSRMVETGRNF